MWKNGCISLYLCVAPRLCFSQLGSVCVLDWKSKIFEYQYRNCQLSWVESKFVTKLQQRRNWWTGTFMLSDSLSLQTEPSLAPERCFVTNSFQKNTFNLDLSYTLLGEHSSVQLFRCFRAILGDAATWRGGKIWIRKLLFHQTTNQLTLFGEK